MNEAPSVPDRAPGEAVTTAATAAARRIGVLLVNLGTPDAPDAPAVRRYLKEFLTDPRVIEHQGPLWDILLNGAILRVRPRRKARDYRKIWNNEKNESPLKTITHSQAEKLASTLQPLGDHVMVDWAMRRIAATSPTASSASPRMRRILTRTQSWVPSSMTSIGG